MTEAIIILPNMRGGCATVGNKVHTLFRVTRRGSQAQPGPREFGADVTSCAALASKDLK